MKQKEPTWSVLQLQVPFLSLEQRKDGNALFFKVLPVGMHPLFWKPMANWNKLFLANNTVPAVLGSGIDDSIPKEVSMSQQDGKEGDKCADGLESCRSVHFSWQNHLASPCGSTL